MPNTSIIAPKRREYQKAQAAMIEAEEAIKKIRREMTVYVRDKGKLIDALLPQGKRHPRALRVELADHDSRTSAAHKQFAIKVIGMKSWHDITSLEVKDLVRLMQGDGWKFGGRVDGQLFWTLTFT